MTVYGVGASLIIVYLKNLSFCDIRSATKPCVSTDDCAAWADLFVGAYLTFMVGFLEHIKMWEKYMIMDYVIAWCGY